VGQAMLRPVAAVVLALGTLAPAACTGDDSSNQPIDIPSSGSTSQGGSTSPPVEGLVALPDHVKVLSDWEPTGESSVDSAVRASINSMRALWAVTAAGDLKAVPYENYVTGAAERVIFDEFAEPFIKAGVGVRGTDRLFAFKVSEVTDASAKVIFCDDQYDLLPTDRKTGKVVPNTPNPAGGSRYTQTVSLVQGRWKVTTHSGEEGVPKCRLEH
jgi:hypothetical protein